MSVRKIINIDEEKCDGCGLCVPNCPEGALRIIDGKARLVSDLFCDGLGACLGHCPRGAIQVEEREAKPYNEKKAMANIVAKGANAIKAHLEHLEAHGEHELLAQAKDFLRETGIGLPDQQSDLAPSMESQTHHAGCPGARTVELTAPEGEAGIGASALSNWPVQLHLISPASPAFAGRDVLLTADCVAYASGCFHGKWLKGKVLAIACPKLDEGTDVYREKITALIDHAKIDTLTVMMMEVPCCRGLIAIAQQALAAAKRKIPLKAVVISIKGGQVLAEERI